MPLDVTNGATPVKLGEVHTSAEPNTLVSVHPKVGVAIVDTTTVWGRKVGHKVGGCCGFAHRSEADGICREVDARNGWLRVETESSGGNAVEIQGTVGIVGHKRSREEVGAVVGDDGVDGGDIVERTYACEGAPPCSLEGTSLVRDHLFREARERDRRRG